ncbi:MAG: mechanosensitive ion channel [Longimicrobiales bacterium]|nr:mechanosensitive ion channel [Longimicrobiales bacterium]
MMALQIPQAQSQDTSSVLGDSLDVSLDRIGEGVSNTGRLILEGEWDLVLERLLSGITNLFIASVPNLISAVFVGIFFYILYRVVGSVTRRVLRRSRGVDRGLEAIVMKTFRVVGWGFILLLVLSQLGINLSALIAGLGIAGLAVGFAAKDSLENFISGLTILLDRPFKVGDWVTVGGYFGQVSNITLRSTRIDTPNRQTVVFPSLQMVNQPLVNHSSGGALRVDVDFGIAYKEDIEETREVVLSVLDGSDDRLTGDLEPRVVVTGLNDSSVDMQLRLFIREAGDQVAVRLDYLEKIRNALGEADIEIPFPHLQLFIDEAEAFRQTPLRISRVEED